jgi:hypothetical protein
MDDSSVPPSRVSSDPDERRALRQLWQYKGSPIVDSCKVEELFHSTSVHSGLDANEESEFSDAIVITPTQIDFVMIGQPLKGNADSHVKEASGVIVINPTATFVTKEHISTPISHIEHYSDLNTTNSTGPQIPMETISSMVVSDAVAEVSYQPDLSSFSVAEFGSKDDAGQVSFKKFQSKEVAAKDARSSQAKQSSSVRSIV